MSNNHSHDNEQTMQDMLQVFQQRMANHVSNYEMQIAQLNAELAKAQRTNKALEAELEAAKVAAEDKDK